MRIFVSYARVDKPYCIHIVETLHAHDVWYDQRLYAGQHWWKEIMRRLDWCEVFIYLLSPDSVNSIYCQKELEVARSLNREIIPVLINKDTEIPDSIENLHYVDMVGNLTVENVTVLLNSILLVERQTDPEDRQEMLESMKEETSLASAESAAEIVRRAAQELESGNFDNAIVLITEAEATGYRSRFVNLDKLRELAEKMIAELTRTKEAEREYQQIVDLYEFEKTRKYACEIFYEFQKEFPDYDPNGLGLRCQKGSAQTSDGGGGNPPPEVLPMLQWCDIPYGIVHVANIENGDGEAGEMAVKVDNFVISKYPVTNIQFEKFLKADDGYYNPKWWQFSIFARKWFELQDGPRGSRFLGDDRPRENVNWYEAMAFCNWLSYLLKMRITLPTVAQWQRAAQGDDDRFFPWGNDYHEDRCNTRESGLKMTTPVTRYKAGISPYDVWDMAGNVWEWTLDQADPDEESPDYRRAVVGGSFVSPCIRAQTSFRYHLDPRVRYSSIGIRLVGLT